jgi:hypothetical protein
MSNLITHYFKHALEALKYPTDDIGYSLSYCQGDGMAFYGDLDSEQLTFHANRLLSGTEKAAAKRAIEKGFTCQIYRNSFGYHYSHYNTMNVSVDDNYYCEDDATEFENAAFEALVEALEADIVSISQTLEEEGYAIAEAGSSVFTLEQHKRTIKTARFQVDIEEIEDEDFDLDAWDEDLALSTLNDFVSGELRYFTLKVTVSSIDGLELGTSYLGGCVESNTQPSRNYGGYLKQAVSEAIEEARESINSVMLAA